MTKFVMMVGIAGSGKSKLSKTLEMLNFKVFSSDDLREEMFGFQDQSRNKELFPELHRRIIKSLKEGHHTIYDATNLNGRQRKAFLNTIKHLKVENNVVVNFSPIEVCEARRAHFPEGVIKKQLLAFNFPLYSEGWDKILINYGVPKKIYREYQRSLIEAAKGFDQKNKHHSLSLLDHMLKAGASYKGPDKIIRSSLFLHDFGKLYTGVEKEDGNFSYHNHENVSAYLALTFTKNIEICQMIQLHMLPYDPNFEKSKKIKEKLGNYLFESLKQFSEADRKAH